MEKMLQWLQWLYIGGAAMLVVLSVGIYVLSARVSSAKEREWQLQITDADARAAEANERAAEANRSASQAQLELARLKEPRRISSEDQKKMIGDVKPYAGQAFSLAVHEDSESFDLARTINDILIAAGWVRVKSQVGAIVRELSGSTVASTVKSGLHVFIGKDNEEAKDVVLVLCGAFVELGMQCRPTRTDDLIGKTPKAVLIAVGKKEV